MKRDKWVWMPHAGHFILGHMCRFRLNTYVGGFIVSTVGEYVPDSQVRNIMVNARKDAPLSKGDMGEAEYLKRYGYERLGAWGTYETMAFKAVKSKEKCCPFKILVTDEMDVLRYDNATDAYKGHMAFCKKWSEK
jgi:hypothetical protein